MRHGGRTERRRGGLDPKVAEPPPPGNSRKTVRASASISTFLFTLVGNPLPSTAGFTYSPPLIHFSDHQVGHSNNSRKAAMKFSHSLRRRVIPRQKRSAVNAHGERCGFETLEQRALLAAT